MADMPKRVNYFDQELLKALDFAAEQAYHVEGRRRLLRTFFNAGVAEGLQVVVGPAAGDVTVQPGIALDDRGRELVLTGPATLDLSGAPAGSDVWITLAYAEELSDPSAPPSAPGHTRVAEAPVLAQGAQVPDDPLGRLILARVTRSATSVATVDVEARRVAEVRGLGELREQLATRPAPAIGANLVLQGGLATSGLPLLRTLPKLRGNVPRGGIHTNNLVAEGAISGRSVSVKSDIRCAGTLGTNGMQPKGGLPSGWTGGLHTLDVYAEGTIAAGPGNGVVKCLMTRDGRLHASVKQFVIDHPLDPEGASLVHAAIEGAEAGVYYRGSGRLEGGTAVVELPRYFEALTRVDGRTVTVTPQLGDDGAVAAMAASPIRDGRFRVRAAAGGDPRGSFWWEVKAVRADVTPLEVEPAKPGAEAQAVTVGAS